MLEVKPDYFDSFKCIAGKCRHSCCIGWEIDIDDKTLSLYEKMEGDLGIKLKNNISFDETPHFILTDNERCPFLNKDNLCEIILEKGENYLSQICTDHPRFRSFFSDRCEIGLGLCCEEAARIILGKKDKTFLKFSQNGEEANPLDDFEAYILKARELTFEIAQDRSLSIDERINEILETFSVSMPQMSFSDWAQFLKKFEILDKNWDILLDKIIKEEDNLEPSKNFQIPFEQLLCYFLYRHLPLSENVTDLKAQVGFSILCLNLVRCLCSIKEKEYGCSFDDLIEFARLCSSEIEYAEENTDGILEIIYLENEK